MSRGPAARRTHRPFRRPDRGGVDIIDPVSFSLSGGSDPTTVTYSLLELTLDPTGTRLSGTGRGQQVISPVYTDVATAFAVTMSVAGIPDTDAPFLTVTGGESIDPFFLPTFAGLSRFRPTRTS